MPTDKVMLVDEDALRRLTCMTALQMAGYEVHVFDNVVYAMQAVIYNGQDPFVMVCQAEGETGTAAEMKQFLNTKENNNHRRYPLVEIGISGSLAAQRLMMTATVPCATAEGDLVSTVKSEFQRMYAPAKSEQYDNVHVAVGF